MNFNKLFLSSFFLILLAWSCITENEEELYPQLNTTKKISFTTDIQPILEANCYSCHNKNNNSNKGFGDRFGEGINLEGEENVKTVIAFDNKKGYLIENIKHSTGFLAMPRGGAPKLSNTQIELIQKWITQEFTIVPNPTDTIIVYDTIRVVITDTIKVKNISYLNDIQPILQNNCYKCHSNTNNPNKGFGDRFGENVTLEGYENVKKVIEFDSKKGYLINNIKHSAGFLAMPRGGAGKLPDSTITKVENWINQGLLNN